mmetsp:Transcript_677/g.1468  ORF Transcript_677/g.1468 Transcript_677/m.1468 type:complete len:85 (+) Transcript_677:371-625(+)
MSHSNIRSTHIITSRLPKKKLGTYDSTFMGITTNISERNAIVYPISLDLIPIRREKMVCEKMYDPVYPPVMPDMILLKPTVCSS